MSRHRRDKIDRKMRKEGRTREGEEGRGPLRVKRKGQCAREMSGWVGVCLVFRDLFRVEAGLINKR